jgi:hypothetical protein
MGEDMGGQIWEGGAGVGGGLGAGVGQVLIS